MRVLFNKLSSCFPAKASLRASLAVCLAASLLVLSGCLSHSLTSIQIIPAAGSEVLASGQTAQFKAIGTYTESGHAVRTKDITSEVSWQSQNTSVATISSTGLATGVASGTSNISASIPGSFGPLSATSNITVTVTSGSGGSGGPGRTLTSMTVIPGSQTLSVTGETAQFIAIGTYSISPTSADLTSQVKWQSSATSVAQVNSAGLVTATGVGTTTITALATGPDGAVISAAGTITVSSAVTARTLVALNVSPGSQTITSTGQQAQFTALGTYNTSPLSANLTNSVTWQSSDPQVATVNSSGLVTGIGIGSATITALATAPDGSVVSNTAAVTVSAAPSGRILTSLSIIPASQSVTAVGETGQYLAIGTYSGAPLTVDLTNQVTWLSSDVKVGTVNSAGLATAVGQGETTITAITTASDGGAIAASATLEMLGTPGQVTLPTLAIYGAGSGSGTVTGPNAISCAYSGPSTAPGSGPGSGCTGTFALGTTVTLKATSGSGSVFDGWSSNCTPVSGAPNECTITMNNNTSVGAIFDPK